jgi:hypothetical protein
MMADGVGQSFCFLLPGQMCSSRGEEVQATIPSWKGGYRTQRGAKRRKLALSRTRELPLFLSLLQLSPHIRLFDDKQRTDTNLSLPISVADPTPLPSLLHHTLHTRLNLNPAEHPLLTTEPSWATPQSRQNMAELVFEQEGVPAWYVATQGVLSAFASGRGTALVVDVGHDLCSITPVYEGYVLRAGKLIFAASVLGESSQRTRREDWQEGSDRQEERKESCTEKQYGRGSWNEWWHKGKWER